MILLQFLKNFLIENPWKIIFFGIFSILLYLSFAISPWANEYDYIYEFKTGEEHNYVYRVDGNLRIHTLGKESENSSIVVLDWTPRILSVFGAIIFLCLWILPCFDSDTGLSWNTETIKRQSYIDMIETIIDGDQHTYILQGRIIYQDDCGGDWRMARDRARDFPKNKSLFPKYNP